MVFVLSLVCITVNKAPMFGCTVLTLCSDCGAYCWHDAVCSYVQWMLLEHCLVEGMLFEHCLVQWVLLAIVLSWICLEHCLVQWMLFEHCLSQWMLFEHCLGQWMLFEQPLVHGCSFNGFCIVFTKKRVILCFTECCIWIHNVYFRW